MANVTMRSRDAIAAKEAEAFFIINGNRYRFMQLLDFEAKIDKKKVAVPILGKRMDGHKTVGMTGTFTATAHYNQSIMRKLLEDYKNTGIDTYFEIQVTNDDKESAAGRQTITLYDCNTDGGILVKFGTGEEVIEEPIEGTFEDFKMPEGFLELEGMR